MKCTVTIQIGNSDNKLSQAEWSRFQNVTNSYVAPYCEFHFAGSSDPTAEWQNRCFVGTIDTSKLSQLKEHLRLLCNIFNQDSIALTVGTTDFIGE